MTSMNGRELLAALTSLPSELLDLPVVFIDQTLGYPQTFRIVAVLPYKAAGKNKPISAIQLSEEVPKVKAKP